MKPIPHKCGRNGVGKMSDKMALHATTNGGMFVWPIGIEDLRQLAELLLHFTQERKPDERVFCWVEYGDDVKLAVQPTVEVDLPMSGVLGEEGHTFKHRQSTNEFIQLKFSEIAHKNCEIWECETCNPIVGKCDGCDQEFRQVEEVKSPVSTCKTCDRRLCVDCDCGHDNWGF